MRVSLLQKDDTLTCRRLPFKKSLLPCLKRVSHHKFYDNRQCLSHFELCYDCLQTDKSKLNAKVKVIDVPQVKKKVGKELGVPNLKVSQKALALQHAKANRVNT